MIVYEMTVQIRVTDMEKGQAWYQALLRREPDFIPHGGFAEWELIPGCWLQVAAGEPANGSGPLRMGVENLEAERELAPEDITYIYRLAEQDGMTTLSAAIGDFAKLPDGEKYYEASLEFGSSAVGKIKELAEVMLQDGGAAHARGHSQKNNR